MLTLINKYKKQYNWSLNIVILSTMFFAIIDIFFPQYNKQLFFSIYTISVILYLIMTTLNWINLFNEYNVQLWYEYASITFYIIDLLFFIISFFFCIFSFQYSIYMIGAIIFSIARLVMFNLNWKLFNKE